MTVPNASIEPAISVDQTNSIWRELQPDSALEYREEYVVFGAGANAIDVADAMRSAVHVSTQAATVELVEQVDEVAAAFFGRNLNNPTLPRGVVIAGRMKDGSEEVNTPLQTIQEVVAKVGFGVVRCVTLNGSDSLPQVAKCLFGPTIPEPTPAIKSV